MWAVRHFPCLRYLTQIKLHLQEGATPSMALSRASASSCLSSSTKELSELARFRLVSRMSYESVCQGWIPCHGWSYSTRTSSGQLTLTLGLHTDWACSLMKPVPQAFSFWPALSQVDSLVSGLLPFASAFAWFSAVLRDEAHLDDRGTRITLLQPSLRCSFWSLQ